MPVINVIAEQIEDSYKIEAILHVIDVKEMVKEVMIGL